MSTSVSNDARVKAEIEYKNALEMYWGGRCSTSIEYLSNLLSDDPNHPSLFPMYRLWIEILAENKDSYALHEISSHLLNRSFLKKRKSNVYMALRGVIHLELDEMQAAKMCYETLKNTTLNNCYGAEFVKRYEFRFSGYTKKTTNLYSISFSKFSDYLSLAYLCNHELIEGSSENHQKLTVKIRSLYPRSPVLRLQKMHLAWDQGEFSSSISVAKSLSKDFPGNKNYSFSLGSSQLLNNDLFEAIGSFNESQSLSSSDDVDTSSLLACIYGFLAMNSEASDIDETAIHSIVQAQRLLRQQGSENNYLSRLETDIRNRDQPMINETNTQQKVWLTQLTAREFSRIKTDPSEEVTDLTMSLGVNVLKGDIILLGRMFEFDADYQEIRVVALYEAVSDAYFDPIQNICTEISLLHRPESSISIPLEAEDGMDESTRRMYELDDFALEEISLHLEEKLTPEETAYWKESFEIGKTG